MSIEEHLGSKFWKLLAGEFMEFATDFYIGANWKLFPGVHLHDLKFPLAYKNKVGDVMGQRVHWKIIPLKRIRKKNLSKTYKI